MRCGERSYLDGFEDGDDGVAFVEEILFAEVGFEKLHAGAGELLLAQGSRVALLLGERDGEFLQHSRAGVEFLELFGEFAHGHVAVGAPGVGPVLLLVFGRGHLLEEIGDAFPVRALEAAGLEEAHDIFPGPVEHALSLGQQNHVVEQVEGLRRWL